MKFNNLNVNLSLLNNNNDIDNNNKQTKKQINK